MLIDGRLLGRGCFLKLDRRFCAGTTTVVGQSKGGVGKLITGVVVFEECVEEARFITCGEFRGTSLLDDGFGDTGNGDTGACGMFGYTTGARTKTMRIMLIGVAEVIYVMYVASFGAYVDLGLSTYKVWST